MTAVVRRRPAGEHTVRAGLDASLRRAVLLGLAVWQAVMVVVLLLSGASHGLALASLHVVLAVLALAATRVPAWFAPALATGFVAWFLDYWSAVDLDDAITLAACWLGNILYGIAALTMSGWRRFVVPIGGAVVVGGGLVVVDATWDVATASAITVTAASIAVAARLCLPALWSLADDVDRSAADLADRRAAQEAARQTALEAAEDARVVHDTVINTLAALVAGGRAVADTGRVRERCARDADVLDDLLAGRRRADVSGLDELDAPGLELRRTGLAGPALREVEALVAPAPVAALAAAAREVLQNVGKHADVDTAGLHVEVRGDDLVVVVEDDGRGFDPERVEHRGLRGSVEDRLRAVGGAALVRSAPGAGTRVEMRIPRTSDTPLAPAGGRSAGEVADAVLRRAAWLWSIGVVAVGVVIELANRPGRLTWTYAMLLLVAATTLLAWMTTRGSRTLPPVARALLVVAAPGGYLLAMLGVGFGTDQTLTYQAIGISPLAAVLLTFGARSATRLLVLLLSTTAAVTALVLGVGDVGRAAVALAAVAPALGMVAGWRAFERLVVQLVDEAERNRELAAASTADAVARRERTAARRRWSTGGLERAAVLLRRVADDPTLATAPTVRAEAAQEEQHLRQLLLLSPTAHRMTTWFARALASARTAGVDLAVRSGDDDAPDAETARALGELVLDAVDAADEGDRVTVGFFPGDTGPRLVLVVPADRPPTVEPTGPWDVDVTRLEQHVVVEVGPAG